jgi:UDP-N-acetylmuramate--alanine ligase
MLSQPPPIVKTVKLMVMHVYFSGIGGAGIGPLALIAKQAGYQVSGSDAKDSKYLENLRQAGIDVHTGQTRDQIAQVHSKSPIDWFVYSSALPKTDPDHPELRFCQDNGIRTSRRDDLLNEIIASQKLKLIAIAGTHGKTTTTAMAIWLMQEFNIPLSYSVGAKLPSGDMGHFQPGSEYFVYEADEYDRNFLSFYPQVSLITGLDWDHPDIFPTRESYYQAFSEFIGQSAISYVWHDDAEKLDLTASDSLVILDEHDPAIESIKLAGRVNRLDAWLAAKALQPILDKPFDELIEKLRGFPGVSRRFEKIIDNLYTDYAHTPPKIQGALQLAHEVAGDNVIVVYEGLHNTRQHFIKNELKDLFKDVKGLYVVPSYLAREDQDLELLTPQKILDLLSIPAKSKASAAKLDENLKVSIKQHLGQGDLVLCLSAGGAGSLDEWLRKEFKN